MSAPGILRGERRDAAGSRAVAFVTPNRNLFWQDWLRSCGHARDEEERREAVPSARLALSRTQPAPR